MHAKYNSRPLLASVPNKAGINHLYREIRNLIFQTNNAKNEVLPQMYGDTSI